jgi:hypothetical protein
VRLYSCSRSSATTRYSPSMTPPADALALALPGGDCRRIVRFIHQTRRPIIEAMISTILPTITNAKKPRTSDALIARAPTIITKMFAIGFPAGNPRLIEEYFKPLSLLSVYRSVWGHSYRTQLPRIHCCPGRLDSALVNDQERINSISHNGIAWAVHHLRYQ